LNKKYVKLLQKFHDEAHYDLCSLPKIGSEELEYTRYVKLLQKFHDETLNDLCSSPKIGSEEFEYKVREITAEVP